MIEIEELVDELRKLIGWGAQPHRLPQHQTLRRVLGVEHDSFRVTGNVMRQQIFATINTLDEGLVDGRRYSADTIRRCLWLLLGFEGSGLTAPERRFRVIKMLQLNCSMERWRRPDSPERDLLRILARGLKVAA